MRRHEFTASCRDALGDWWNRTVHIYCGFLHYEATWTARRPWRFRVFDLCNDDWCADRPQGDAKPSECDWRRCPRRSSAFNVAAFVSATNVRYLFIREGGLQVLRKAAVKLPTVTKTPPRQSGRNADSTPLIGFCIRPYDFYSAGFVLIA